LISCSTKHEKRARILSEGTKRMLLERDTTIILGSGGYRSVVPKWERMEAEMIAKG